MLGIEKKKKKSIRKGASDYNIIKFMVHALMVVS